MNEVKEKNNKIWARLGVTVFVSEDEREDWLKNPNAMFKKALKEGRVKLDGDTYFPEEANENIDYFGENYNEIGWDC